jgi:plastocyanin
MRPVAVLCILLLGLSISVLTAGCTAPGDNSTTPAAPPTPMETGTPAMTPIQIVPPEREGNVTIELVADDQAFDQRTIVVPAGAEVTVEFENLDMVPHNLAVYRTSDANDPIFVGEIIDQGSITYTFTAPEEPGMYFFRCDVHPTDMTGNFVVR